MKDFLKNSKNRKILQIFWGIISVFLIILISILWTKTFLEYKEAKRLERINSLLEDFEVTKTQCENIFSTHPEKLFDKNERLLAQEFEDKKLLCNNRFNISYETLHKWKCLEIIRRNESQLAWEYLVLDNLQNIKNYCFNSYFDIKIKKWKLFDELNEFKSQIVFSFWGSKFYEDVWQEGSELYIENRIQAKKRFLALLQTSENISVGLDDIILYPTSAILELNLEPTQTYTFSILEAPVDLESFPNIDQLVYSWEFKPNDNPHENVKKDNWELPAIKRENFSITLPENKYLGLFIKNPVTLYRDSNQPTFRVIDYNSGRKVIVAKICRIPNESYAQAEVFIESKNKLFYQAGIDNIETYQCYEKTVTLEEAQKNAMQITEFDFSNELWEIARSGLYYVTFQNPENRFFNQRYQQPLLFWIVDSHITMKVSKNGEAFFFVNDFEWTPLANQNIRIAVNDFSGYNRYWNSAEKTYEKTYNSPLENWVFQKAQYLWVTDENGVLQVNLSDFVSDAYQKTFWEWYYEYSKGKFESFMVTSSSETNLSYVTSRFNAGITPWNFWYSTQEHSYYGNKEYKNDIVARQYLWKQKTYFAHIFPDRKLYLPWETAHIKSVLRKSKDLSIPESQSVEVKIYNPKNVEIYSTWAIINDFWSINISYDISESSDLGSYRAKIFAWNEYIAETGWSVEVFQKPKFKNDVMLETSWLDEGYVDIQDSEEFENYGWTREIYLWSFDIQWKVISQYYNGRMLQNADFEYKIYKQRYIGSDYWENCYYGCYWEPSKEFYTEGKWKLNSDGIWEFHAKVQFDSDYYDYKYIVEVTVKDDNGDVISWTSSVVARLPEKFKKYNWNSQLFFQSDEKIVKAWEKLNIKWGLNVGNWSNSYNNAWVLIIKKRDYQVTYREDVRGKIPRNHVQETIVDILPINDKIFDKKEWKLSLWYVLPEVWEYVIEYGNIWLNYHLSSLFGDELESQEIVSEILDSFVKNKTWDIEFHYNEDSKVVISLDDFITSGKKYFTIVTYGDSKASNPEYHDNKLQVISEKVSYKPGETAKVLVRLPYENAKILWTVEKQDVVEYEYIDVPGNTFFKEVKVDDTFEPNAYIWVVMVDTRSDVPPEYKVWYTEIVVDKSHKVSDIELSTDKKQYAPRETVTLDIQVKDKQNTGIKSELTVMVVDDSLISLLGNVDLNILEKVYKKLPFQTQTQITSVAMLQNFYFARKWIVGWSGLWSFKWWDSAISSRNIFKNTAFYDANILTNEQGKAEVSFELPDNITNFRVMVVSNSKKNYFWYAQELFEVRKNILIEEKMPLIMRTKDEITIGANVFNMTQDTQKLQVSFEAEGVKVENQKQKITLKKWEKQFVTWKVINESNPEKIQYSITAEWKSSFLSDRVEKTIAVKSSPVLYSRERKTAEILEKWIYEDEFELPDNIDKKNSYVELIFSNNKLYGLEKTLQSLLVYPYGCIEQSVSSTYPNAILKKLNKLLAWTVPEDEIDKNLTAWIDRIFSKQNTDGWFGYWSSNESSDLTITPYVVRSLIEMKNMWVEIDQTKLNKAILYLQNNYTKAKDNVQKAEIAWALTQAGKYVNLNFSTVWFDRHAMIAYTYALYNQNKSVNINAIYNNILKIENMMNDSSSSYYWNELTDKGLFLQLLIDVRYDQTIIDNKISELYEYDFESFYYSTKTKNAAFTAFAKYIEAFGSEKYNAFGFSLWKIQNRDQVFSEYGSKQAIIKKKYRLEEILYNDKIDLKVANLVWDKMYVDFIFHKVPENREDIEAFNNGINVSRTHYLVTDESKIWDCTQKYRWYIENNEIDCTGVFEELKDGKYQKWKIYKSEVRVELSENVNYKDLVLEEYLASGFEIIQSKFNTESIAVEQGNRNNLWMWWYTQNMSDRAMAHAKYVYNRSDREVVYEFYFRPNYQGTFTLPPVTAYLMYRPDIRAHTKFSSVEVK